MATKFGRYELLERVSVGGMAEVFKGRASGAAGFEKIVAIKRILPHLSDDQEFISMFIDEAKISANLNHSNIGQVFEFGQCNHQYFIAMEYIQGRDLRFIHKWFRQQNQTLPVNMALHIILGVCNGLDYALAPISLRALKRVLNAVPDTSLKVALDVEGHSYEKLRWTEDYQEGINSFAEKRKAQFKGR